MSAITVIGSFMTDMIFQAPRRPMKGETIIGNSFNIATGGKGANQAVQAALLGGEVYMIGRIGDDLFGKMQIESLKKAGVRTDFVITDKTSGTGVASIVIDAEGDNSIVIIPRANLNCVKQDIDNAEYAIKKAEFILLQLEIPLEVNKYAIEKSLELGKKVILDPAPAIKLDEFFYKNVYIITPNETEASIITNVEVKSIDNAKKAAEKLYKLGTKNVIITLGEKGVLLFNEKGEKYIPPLKVEVKDTTAAGDAFTGSLAFWLLKGYEIEKAVELSNVVGALSTTKIGAQPSLPNLESVENFLEKQKR